LCRHRLRVEVRSGAFSAIERAKSASLIWRVLIKRALSSLFEDRSSHDCGIGWMLFSLDTNDFLLTLDHARFGTLVDGLWQHACAVNVYRANALEFARSTRHVAAAVKLFSQAAYCLNVTIFRKDERVCKLHFFY